MTTEKLFNELYALACDFSSDVITACDERDVSHLNKGTFQDLDRILDIIKELKATEKANEHA